MGEKVFGAPPAEKGPESDPESEGTIFEQALKDLSHKVRSSVSKTRSGGGFGIYSRGGLPGPRYEKIPGPQRVLIEDSEYDSVNKLLAGEADMEITITTARGKKQFFIGQKLMLDIDEPKAILATITKIEEIHNQEEKNYLLTVKKWERPERKK